MVCGCFFLRDVSEEHKKLSLEEETMWLRIRSLTLRLISGLPSLNHSVGPENSEKTTENGVSSRIDIFRLLLQQLEGPWRRESDLLRRTFRYHQCVFIIKAAIICDCLFENRNWGWVSSKEQYFVPLYGIYRKKTNFLNLGNCRGFLNIQIG